MLVSSNVDYDREDRELFLFKIYLFLYILLWYFIILEKKKFEKVVVVGSLVELQIYQSGRVESETRNASLKKAINALDPSIGIRMSVRDVKESISVPQTGCT